MTIKTVSQLRVLDSILHRSSLLQAKPRSIDRYIDYFGDGSPRIPAK